MNFSSHLFCCVVERGYHTDQQESEAEESDENQSEEDENGEDEGEGLSLDSLVTKLTKKGTENFEVFSKKIRLMLCDL